MGDYLIAGWASNAAFLLVFAVPPIITVALAGELKFARRGKSL
jgi:hypothetical protein